mmetsp:Transcript_18751/g.25410  ORF Transcript_18751/g.25410 Transcript_18751/m.25410 type:complete len:140 (+) Transcript_18751:854-1273(+)
MAVNAGMAPVVSRVLSWAAALEFVDFYVSVDNRFRKHDGVADELVETDRAENADAGGSRGVHIAVVFSRSEGGGYRCTGVEKDGRQAKNVVPVEVGDENKVKVHGPVDLGPKHLAQRALPAVEHHLLPLPAEYNGSSIS